MDGGERVPKRDVEQYEIGGFAEGDAARSAAGIVCGREVSVERGGWCEAFGLADDISGRGPPVDRGGDHRPGVEGTTGCVAGQCERHACFRE
jgi:hypothetical protein